MHEACLNAMTDVEALRALVRTQLEIIAQRDAAIAHHLDAIAQREQLVAKLNHQLSSLRRVQFAVCSVHRAHESGSV